MQAPMTEERIAAERDVLLAAHAVERARLEHRLAVAEDDLAGLRVMSGRQSVQIIALQADAAERESLIFDMRSELDKGTADRNDLVAAQAANEVALHEALVERDRAQSLYAAASARLEDSKAESSRDRAKIAISLARAEHLEELLASAEAARAKADKAVMEGAQSLAARNQKVGELEDRLRRTAGDEQDLAGRLQRAKLDRAEAATQMAELEARLRRSEQLREDMLIERARQLAALAEQDAELRAARAKTAELQARLGPCAANSAAGSAIVAVAAEPGSSILASPAELERLQRKCDDVRARTLDARRRTGCVRERRSQGLAPRVRARGG